MGPEEPGYAGPLATRWGKKAPGLAGLLTKPPAKRKGGTSKKGDYAAPPELLPNNLP